MLGRGFRHKLGYQCQASGDSALAASAHPCGAAELWPALFPLRRAARHTHVVGLPTRSKTIRNHSIDYRNGRALRPPGILESTVTAL